MRSFVLDTVSPCLVDGKWHEPTEAYFCLKKLLCKRRSIDRLSVTGEGLRLYIHTHTQVRLVMIEPIEERQTKKMRSATKPKACAASLARALCVCARLD